MNCKSVFWRLVMVLIFIIAGQNGYSADCFSVSYVSDGTGSKFCPSGYAIQGITCQGQYCDNKIIKCCPYMNGNPDREIRGGWSPRFSEEPPNNFYTNNRGWIAGIACFGSYCDNISLNYFYTKNLRNTGQCGFRRFFSEEQGSDECPPGQFVSGMRCNGAYCDNISLYCCQSSR